MSLIFNAFNFFTLAFFFCLYSLQKKNYYVKTAPYYLNIYLNLLYLASLCASFLHIKGQRVGINIFKDKAAWPNLTESVTEF